MHKFSNYNVVCMLINRLLKLLGEEAEIDDELYEKIHDNMIERLKDKVAEIRAQAVHALQRLQDPRDDQCPIIKVSVIRGHGNFSVRGSGPKNFWGGCGEGSKCSKYYP